MLQKMIVAVALLGVVGLSGAFGQALPKPSAPPDLAEVHVLNSKLNCNACHGDKPPLSVNAEESLATVNKSCTTCHGDAKAVAAMILPKLTNKEINPHASHLVQIDCVTCHHGHTASEVYCNECHSFDLSMPPKAGK